jgi:dimethylargininase
VPEENGVNVIALNETSLLVDASAKQTIELFKSMALQVVPMDISESSKVYGNINCNSVRITQLPRDSPIFQELDRAAQEGG